MKVSGKGVIVILLFFVGIPALVDMILVFSLGKKGADFGMTSFLLPRFAKAFPFYIAYLILVFVILFFIKKWKTQRKEQDE